MIPVVGAVAALAVVSVPIVVKVLAGLGFGVLVYTGLTAMFDAAYDAIVQSFSQLPVEVLQLLAIANFDRAISMIFSAYGVRLAMQGVSSSGILRRFGVVGVSQSA